MKLTRHENKVVLELDERLLSEVGLAAGCEVTVVREGDALVVRAADIEQRFQHALETTDKQYSDVFARLAQ